MSEIKIVEKIVAPNAGWANLVIDERDEALERCAYKVVFDRTYPYFWIWAKYGGIEQFGLALTYADVERAAVFDESTGLLTKFNLYSDGVLPFSGNMAYCIAMGARRAFYLLSNASYQANGGGFRDLCISAQDDPVCPFVVANPWTS